MDRFWLGPMQHRQCCTRLAACGDAIFVTFLFDLDLLRIAPNGTTVEVDQHHICRSLRLRNLSVFLFGYGCRSMT